MAESGTHILSQGTSVCNKIEILQRKGVWNARLGARL